jgi:hypothetical protein
MKVGSSVVENPCGDRSSKNENVLDPLLWAKFSENSSENTKEQLIVLYSSSEARPMPPVFSV